MKHAVAAVLMSIALAGCTDRQAEERDLRIMSLEARMTTLERAVLGTSVEDAAHPVQKCSDRTRQALIRKLRKSAVSPDQKVK